MALHLVGGTDPHPASAGHRPPASARRETTRTQLGNNGSARAAPERHFVETADGHRLAYVVAGEGPDLVLLHGALMALEDMWLGPMDALTRHFRVHAFDRPGHGESTRVRLQEATSWRQAAILRDACAVLGLERPVVVGHSFGGAVALSWAMAHGDEIRGVAALAPICFPEVRLEQVLFGPLALPLAGEALAHGLGGVLEQGLLPLLWRALFLPQPMPERFAREFAFERVRAPAALIANGEDSMALWQGLTRAALGYAACAVPVRILGGTADLVVNNALHGQNAARLLPQGSFRWLAGIGHMLHHARADAVVAAARGLALPKGKLGAAVPALRTSSGCA